MRFPPRLLVAVALGGALGSVVRWGLQDAVPDGGGVPWTTFAINLSGSALLAALVLLPLVRRSATWSAALGPGVLGGYTTFSATSEQGRALLADGDTALALAYLALTLVSCVGVAVLVGRLAPAPDPGGEQ